MARTLLFVPATRLDRIEKALASGADAVIVDLEDAVAESEKDTARAELEAGWPGISDPARILIRINARSSPHHAQDLLLCERIASAGIVVPKVDRPDDLSDLLRAMDGKACLPLIESARGWFAAPEIARVPGVTRLVFGSLDFQADLDLRPEDEEHELLPVRLALVAASRAARIAPPVDGVTLSIQDKEASRKAARRARRLGFGGKLCIHPGQIAPVLEAFQPSAVELAWAQRVTDAAQRAGGAAVQLDGQMIDVPVVLLAQRILARG